MPEQNRYIGELKKCEGSPVIVKTLEGDTVEGTCIAINYTHLNVVLMTDKEKIIIKNPQIIWRKRKSKKKIFDDE